MKEKKLHPAVETVAKKTKKRYIAFAVSVLLCAVIIIPGFIIKPKSQPLVAEKFTNNTQVGKYAKSDLTLIYAMFSQDALDEDGNVTGENYYILAVDADGKKFMINAPKEYYEKTLKPLESNSVQDIESGMLEILDENLKVEVFGYVGEMSSNLTQQLDNYLKGYEDNLFKNILEVVEEPVTTTPVNYFFVAGGAAGIVSLIILITAVSSSAELSRVKKKYSSDKKDKK